MRLPSTASPRTKPLMRAIGRAAQEPSCARFLDWRVLADGCCLTRHAAEVVDIAMASFAVSALRAGAWATPGGDLPA